MSINAESRSPGSHLVSLATCPGLEVIHHPLEEHHAHEHVVVVFRDTLAGSRNLWEKARDVWM